MKNLEMNKSFILLFLSLFIWQGTMTAQPYIYSVSTSIATLNPPQLGGFGGPPGPAGTCDCPSGYVAVGYDVDAASWIRAFRLICKELNSDGTLGAVTINTCSNGPAGVYPPLGSAVSVGDEAMVATRLRIGGAIDRIEGFSKPIIEIGAVDANTNNTCLLYTSPSPRDS